MLKIRYRQQTLMIVVAIAALGLVVLMQRVYLARANVRMELHRAEAESSSQRAAIHRARADKELAAMQAQFELMKSAGKKAMDKAEMVPWEEENAPGGLERERRSDRRSRESATPGSVRPTGKS